MTIFKKQLQLLEGKKIAILGLGIENYALIKFLLKKKINCMITICDDRTKIKLGNKYENLHKRKNISWKIGKKRGKRLDGFDILFRSPGWPLFDEEIKNAVDIGVLVSSPMKLFMELCPTKNIIGVTGTKGKGTTSSLIYAILKKAKKQAWLGGNIGVAPFDFLEKINKTNWVVLELSSFQLEDMDISPKIAVITNFTPEHLAAADPLNPNYHKNLHSYWQAKLNIINFQKRGSRAILNCKLKDKKIEFGNSKKIFFKHSNLETTLPGSHNKENIAAAIEVAKFVKIKEKIIAETVRKFRGLPFRIEFVKKAKGIEYYNDSFATIPESTITALKSFKPRIILLAGGAEKDSNYKILAKEIKKRTLHVILFEGDASLRLKKEIIKARYPKKYIKTANSMKEAVKISREVSREGDIVLMSPGCASFGMFKNYKDRGKQFETEVRKIKQ